MGCAPDRLHLIAVRSTESPALIAATDKVRALVIALVQAPLVSLESFTSRPSAAPRFNIASSAAGSPKKRAVSQERQVSLKEKHTPSRVSSKRSRP